jgi:hypothetical protein
LKGQYLAVETVFTFGLGLMLAIGVITLFDQYKSEVLSSAEPEQAEMVQTELLLAMDSLKEADESGEVGSGRYKVDLPDTLAGKSYFIRFDDGLLVEAGDESYSMNPNGFTGYDLQGSVEGGDVTIFKQGNNFTLRAQ